MKLVLLSAAAAAALDVDIPAWLDPTVSKATMGRVDRSRQTHRTVRALGNKMLKRAAAHQRQLEEGDVTPAPSPWTFTFNDDGMARMFECYSGCEAEQAEYLALAAVCDRPVDDDDDEEWSDDADDDDGGSCTEVNGMIGLIGTSAAACARFVEECHVGESTGTCAEYPLVWTNYIGCTYTCLCDDVDVMCGYQDGEPYAGSTTTHDYSSDACDLDDYSDVEFEDPLGDGELCADGYNTCTEGALTWCCGGDHDHCTDDLLMCSSLSESEKKKAVRALAGALLAMIIIPILCVCGCVIAGMVMCCKKRPAQQGTTAGGGIGMT